MASAGTTPRTGRITATGWLGIIAAGLSVSLVALGSRYNFGATEYLQLVLDGLRGGAIYALVALGFVTVYRVTGVINFAQGAFIMLGPMITIELYQRRFFSSPQLNLFAAALLAVVITAMVGVMIERLALHPARRSLPLTKIIITIGAYLAVQGAALILWGPQGYILPAFTTLELADRSFRFAGLLVKAQSLWIWGAVAVTLALLALFFERTLLGKAMRACAVNRLAAQLMGIRVDAMATLAFALAAILGSIGGIVLGPVTRPTYDMGLDLGLKGFVAAIIGGLVSFPVAVLGGLLLGILENLWAGVTQAGFRDLFAFVVLILMLLVRPRVLMGAEAQEEHG
jgi:branched-chain amino acid transport system permease protein